MLWTFERETCGPLEKAFFSLSLESLRCENTLTYTEPIDVFRLWGSTKYQNWRYLSFFSPPVYSIFSYLGGFLYWESQMLLFHLFDKLDEDVWSKLGQLCVHSKTLILEQMIRTWSDSFELTYWNEAVAEAAASGIWKRGIWKRACVQWQQEWSCQEWLPDQKVLAVWQCLCLLPFLWFLSTSWAFCLPSIV